jgi:hypothetical protein
VLALVNTSLMNAAFTSLLIYERHARMLPFIFLQIKARLVLRISLVKKVFVARRVRNNDR